MSYASELRAEICSDPPRELCCARSALLGLFLPSALISGEEVTVALAGDGVVQFTEALAERVYHAKARISTRRGGGGARTFSFSSKAALNLVASTDELSFSVECRLKCPACGQYFLRGLFLSCGHACDPASELRLELTPARRASQISSALAEMELPPLLSKRRGKTVLYYRSGTLLLDLLGRMQLLDAMYALSDALIVRDFKNQETRSTNCIIKNLKSSSDARSEQLRVIRILREKNLLTSLPEDLQNTAKLLLENSDDSLAQLAMKSVPSLTKSGIYHRLLKIMHIAQEMQICGKE